MRVRVTDSCAIQLVCFSASREPFVRLFRSFVFPAKINKGHYLDGEAQGFVYLHKNKNLAWAKACMRSPFGKCAKASVHVVSIIIFTII